MEVVAPPVAIGVSVVPAPFRALLVTSGHGQALAPGFRYASGSPAAQASAPPVRFSAVHPASLSAFAAVAERPPMWQATTTVTSWGSSSSRSRELAERDVHADGVGPRLDLVRLAHVDEEDVLAAGDACSDLVGLHLGIGHAATL